VHAGGSYRLSTGAFDAHLEAHMLDLRKVATLVLPKGADVPSTSLTIQARARGSQRAPEIDAQVDGVSHAFEWRSRRRYLRLDETHVEARAHATAQRLSGELRLVTVGGGPEALVRLDLPLGSGSLAALPLGSGSLAALPLDAEVQLMRLPLDRYRAFLPPRLGTLRGAADLHARLAGSIAHPRGEMNLQIHGWALENMRPSETSAEVSLVEHTLRARLASTLGGGDAGRIELALETGVDVQRAVRAPKSALEAVEHTTPVELALTVARLDLAHLPLAALGVHIPFDAGALDAALMVTGTLHQPHVLASLSARGLARAGVMDRLDTRGTFELADDQAHADLSVALRGQDLLDVSVRATLLFQRLLDHQRWQDGALAIDAVIPTVDVSRYRDLAPRLATLSGKLFGRLSVRGTFAAPRAEAGLRASDLRLGSARFPVLTAEGALTPTAARARLDARQVEGGKLTLDGQLDRRGDGPLLVRLHAERLELGFLAALSEEIRGVRGQLDADVTVRGSLARPAPTARVNLSGLHVTLPDARTYTDGKVELTVDQGRATLTRLELRSGKGRLEASGSAQLAGLLPQGFRVDAKTDAFVVSAGTLTATLDADIGLEGERVDGALHGRMEVRRATMHIPKIVSPRQLQSLDPMEDVRFRDRLAREEAAQAAADKREATIAVHLPGPFYVRSREVNADLKGDLDVSALGSEVTLTGQLDAQSGWLELLGRRYELDRARVGFSGPPGDPDLDVRLTRQLTEAQLVIVLQGSAKHPKLQLSSDPPIYDESQMLGIVLSGDPATQRISDKSLDQMAVGALSGLIAGQIKDKIAPALPIDVLKIQTAGQDFAGLTQTRLEVGKFIADNVYVSYVHQFGGPPGLGVTNANEARVEYRFHRRFEVVTTFGDAGQGAIDLYWALRY
jgi:autotransporter translocation and assembly factor TamB